MFNLKEKVEKLTNYLVKKENEVLVREFEDAYKALEKEGLKTESIYPILTNYYIE